MVRRLVPPLVWFLALMGAWMLYVASTQLPEIVLGAGSAAFATAGVLVICSRLTTPRAPRLRWLLSCWHLIPRLFSDTALVFVALGRQLFRGERAAGSFRAIAYSGEYPDASTGEAADAFVITANSITPNTIVLDVDRLEGLVLVHQLVPERPWLLIP